MSVPVMRPVGPPPDFIVKYLSKIRKSGIYSNYGPLVQDLEERFAKYFNIDKSLVVLCSNATQAISASVVLSPATSFICPAFTFAATPLALQHSCKKFMFADIDDSTWDLDVYRIIKKSGQGLVSVLPFGDNPNYEKFGSFECVVFDAAASIGNPNLDLHKLKENWVAIFSLHATKILGIGEGGIAVFGSKKAAINFRKYINFGFWETRKSSLLGSNIKISEYTAAIGHAALDDIKQEFDEWNDSRQSVTAIENDLELNSFSSRFSGVNPYWILEFESTRLTNHVESVLSQFGIETRRWWGTGMHNWEVFKHIEWATDLTNTDKVANTYLGLPFYRSLEDSVLNQIKLALKKTC